MSFTTASDGLPTQLSPSKSLLKQFDNPGNGRAPSETPVLARKTVTLPRYIRGQEVLGSSLAQGNGALASNPLRSLVASPATPNTPTPVAQLGSGYGTISFNPSYPCGKITPGRSFSPSSDSSLSPPDSPYPTTPKFSSFDSFPSVAGGEDIQNEADPFETSARVLDKVGEALAAVPLKPDPQQAYPQESLRSTGGRVGPNKTSDDVPTLGRFASQIDKPFTRGESLSFYHPSRQYTLDQKNPSNSNGGAPNAVFLLRSSPQIVEEDCSDDGFELEDQGGDTAVYSFPCEDSKVNELVSAMACLDLGTGSIVARPTIIPTRARVRVSHFVPARGSALPPAVVPRFVVAKVSATQQTVPMEVDEDVHHPRVAINRVSHLQGASEAAPMDGVVFHPEANDMEMGDTFVTLPGAVSPTSSMRGPSASEGLRFFAHNLPLELLGTRNLHRIEHNVPFSGAPPPRNRLV